MRHEHRCAGNRLAGVLLIFCAWLLRSSFCGAADLVMAIQTPRYNAKRFCISHSFGVPVLGDAFSPTVEARPPSCPAIDTSLVCSKSMRASCTTKIPLQAPRPISPYRLIAASFQSKLVGPSFSPRCCSSTTFLRLRWFSAVFVAGCVNLGATVISAMFSTFQDAVLFGFGIFFFVVCFGCKIFVVWAIKTALVRHSL